MPNKKMTIAIYSCQNIKLSFYMFIKNKIIEMKEIKIYFDMIDAKYFVRVIY